MKRIFLLLIFQSIIFSSCTNVSEEDLIAKEPQPTITTYNDDVKTIIDNNCIVCHANPPVNGAPISLTTFNDVKNAVTNSNLINRISRQAGESGAMPFGGPRLPQNLIDIIQKWEDDGLLEE
ncbi:hypothetical protein [Flavivirga algicola]|uniref:Cytochrome c domain-containing protein n=1 Tax=Flavivirga algicola TaxID=2729136 RepID=A0ABX1RVE0_9FLAO|nr:hypothetical protein [Flavivirga algicola]NMH86658.1 hypothetical protein [Flavivirga algicola]